MRTYRNADTAQAIRAAREYADSRGPGENLPTIVRDVCDAFEAGRPVSVETEGYNGWTNRETWAVALWINNDQGWQESVYEALREFLDHGDTDPLGRNEYAAGAIIRENVDNMLESLWEFHSTELRGILQDFGSLWRVDWDELGAAFLSDIEE